MSGKGGKGSHRTCEICGVKERKASDHSFFARFPLDESRCRAWLKAVGKEELVHLPIEKLHQLRFVCGNHFKGRDITKTGNRLKKRAIPVVNLSATPLSDAQLIGFPQHMAKEKKEATPTTFCLHYNLKKSVQEERLADANKRAQQNNSSAAFLSYANQVRPEWTSGAAQVDHEESQSQVVVEEYQVILEESQVVLEDSQVVLEDCQVVLEDPQLVIEDPQVMPEESQVVIGDSQVVLEESQVDLDEFQVGSEETPVEHDESDIDRFSVDLDDEVEPIEFGKMKLDLGDESLNERSAKTPLVRKEVDELVKCSRCSALIQQHVTLYRCVECADAALCRGCSSFAHVRHCVMRLPSTRVYRVLESVFQQLRLEVRSRLYPDGDMLQLDSGLLGEAALKTGRKCLDEESECADDEEWLPEVAREKCSDAVELQSASADGEEWRDTEEMQNDEDEQPPQPPDDGEPFLQHFPLLEVKEEEDTAIVLSDSTNDSEAELQMLEPNIYSTPQDTQKRPKNKSRKHRHVHRESEEESENEASVEITTLEQLPSSIVAPRTSPERKENRSIHSPREKRARTCTYTSEKDDRTKEISENTETQTILEKKQKPLQSSEEQRQSNVLFLRTYKVKSRESRNPDIPGLSRKTRSSKNRL